jgi:hypothetical protein
MHQTLTVLLSPLAARLTDLKCAAWTTQHGVFVALVTFSAFSSVHFYSRHVRRV